MEQIITCFFLLLALLEIFVPKLIRYGGGGANIKGYKALRYDFSTQVWGIFFILSYFVYALYFKRWTISYNFDFPLLFCISISTSGLFFYFTKLSFNIYKIKNEIENVDIEIKKLKKAGVESFLCGIICALMFIYLA